MDGQKTFCSHIYAGFFLVILLKSIKAVLKASITCKSHSKI